MPFSKEYFDYLLEQNKALLEQNKALTEEINRLNQTVNELSQTIKELNEKLNKNSKNSSKPPSSDGLKKSTKSLRGSSGKKQGGQTGHEGTYLSVVGKPDETVKHMPDKCRNCPNRKKCETKACITETRHVVDIVVETNVVAHEVYEIECPRCGKNLKGSFPEGINARIQYGENLSALVVSLNTVGALSINRVHEILSGVFEIPISNGTINSMVLRAACSVSSTVDDISNRLLEEYHLHCDETGTRVDGRTKWVHVISNEFYTYLALHDKRGKKAMNDIGLLARYHGIVTHDCWGSYWSCDGDFRHSVCCAHLLRELNGVMENHPDQKWAKQFYDLLINMKKVREKAENKSLKELSYYHLHKFNNQYEEIIELAKEENPVPDSEPGKKGRKKKGKVRALIERLEKYKAEVCLFTKDFEIPFDNNQAERDFRMIKTKTKVSGCFRTDEGATAYLKIMSYIGTAKKHGINAFKALLNAITGNPSVALT